MPERCKCAGGRGLGVERATGFEPATFSLGMGPWMRARVGPSPRPSERDEPATGGLGRPAKVGSGRRAPISEAYAPRRVGTPADTSGPSRGRMQAHQANSLAGRRPRPPRLGWRGSPPPTDRRRADASMRGGAKCPSHLGTSSVQGALTRPGQWAGIDLACTCGGPSVQHAAWGGGYVVPSTWRVGECK